MRHRDVQRGEGDQLLSTPSIAQLITVVFVGGALGMWISLSGRQDPSIDLLVWAAVAAALTATAGVVASSGWTSWRALVHLRPGDMRAEFVLAAGIVVLGALAAAASFVVSDNPSVRGTLLVGAAILGAIPPIMAMARVRTITMSTDDEGSAVVDLLVSLRLVLVRQLRGLGALVALATMALALSPFRDNMFTTDDAGGEGSVLILGGVGSALVAVAYVPAALALRSRVGALARGLMPINDQDEGESVLGRLKGRQELVKLVMGERGIYDELLTSLVVAAPLLSATIGDQLTG